jgi:hypothetical protein
MVRFQTFKLLAFAGLIGSGFLGWQALVHLKNNPAPGLSTAPMPGDSLATTGAAALTATTQPHETKLPARASSTMPVAENRPFPPPSMVGEPTPKIIASLEEAAISYDASRVPEIVPYLYSEHAEIRSAATDALVTLGDASGAEAIYQAARFVPDPREAESMLQKAAFLSLPPGTLSSRKKNKHPSSVPLQKLHSGDSQKKDSPPPKTD